MTDSTPTVKVDLDELEALAKAATPGPWHSAACKPECAGSDRCAAVRDVAGEPLVLDGVPGRSWQGERAQANREFIAALNPVIVTALIAEVRASRDTRVCKRCHGEGVVSASSSAGLRGGKGGQMLTAVECPDCEPRSEP